MNIQAESDSQFYKRRWILVFCLIPILSFWCVLIACVPITNFASSGSMSLMHSLKKRTLSILLMNYKNDWEQTLTFDTSSGRLFVDEVFPFSTGWNASLKSLQKMHSKDGKPHKRWQLPIMNSETGNVESVREFDFPADRYPRVVGQRFVVDSKQDLLLVADTSSPNMIAAEYPTKGMNDNCIIIPIKDTNNFVRINDKIPPEPKTQLPLVGLELFGINEEGVPRLVNSWNARPGGTPIGFMLFNNQFVTINPTSRNFEFRSTADGTLISSSSLPQELDLATDYFYLARGKLQVGRDGRTYSLKKMRWMNTPKGALGAYTESPDGKLQLWGGKQEWMVTDSDSEQELARFERQQAISAEFLDNETILLCSPRWGYTFHTVSARTGKTIKTWRPIWWVVPSLLIVVPAYLVWSIFWLKSASASSDWVWGDIALVSGLSIVALSVRFAFVGDILDMNRYPCHLNQGIFLALMFVSCVWLWSGHQSVVRRVLPLLLPWLHILFVASSPAFAWFLAMAKNRFIFLVGVCLAFAIFASILFDVLYFFVECSWFFRFWNQWDVSLRISATAFITTFLLAWAFRQRGWRWDNCYVTHERFASLGH